MPDAVAELTSLNATFATAEREGDVAFFRRHLADGLRFRRASGKVVDKDTFLKDLRAAGNTNEILDASDIEVLPYGEDLAVVSVRIRFKGTRGGMPVDGVFRNIRVFVRAGGVWTCAVWFNTKE